MSELESATRRRLWILTALGALAALWAIVLWQQLLTARAGGTPLCGFGESGDCAELWDAAFASRVHSLTGVPVAGWGLVWGLVATALPLLALRRREPAFEGATRLVALAGLGGLCVLLGVSYQAGLFCTSCALTYVLTLAYGIVALRGGLAGIATSGVTGRSALATVVAFLLVLWPGLQTPRDTQDLEREALAQVAAKAASRSVADAPTTPPPREPAPADDPASSAVAGAPASPSASELGLRSVAEIEAASGRDFGAELRELIESLPEDLQQALADSIYFYENARFKPLREPRAPHGSIDAPVRLTEFTDTLCKHCATLHTNLEYILPSVPPGSFSYDARQFPLDGHCNSKIQARGEETVRCMAAKAKICMEGSPSAFDFAGDLYEHRDNLYPERVYELAEAYAFRVPLEECIAREETRQKLEDDIDYAWEYEPRGTPLLLINGREAPPFGPFIFAMILAGGDSDHPLFDELLPAPNRDIPLPR